MYLLQALCSFPGVSAHCPSKRLYEWQKWKHRVSASPRQAWIAIHGGMWSSFSYRYPFCCCRRKKKEFCFPKTARSKKHTLCFLMGGTWLVIYLLEIQFTINAFPQFLTTRCQETFELLLFTSYSDNLTLNFILHISFTEHQL